MPPSTRPGLVRQASEVGVNVGPGESVEVARGVREAIDGRFVGVGVGWFEDEQAVMIVRSVSIVNSSFVA